MSRNGGFAQDSPRFWGENHVEEQNVWVCTDQTHGLDFSSLLGFLPQECMLSVKKYYPTSWSWRFLFLSVITRRTLTVSWCRCPSSWQPSIFHHFSVFRGSFGKVSCLAFSLFARLCTRTELNSGLCCAADCIGDGSALGPAVRAVWIPIWLWLTVCHGKIHHAINR